MSTENILYSKIYNYIDSIKNLEEYQFHLKLRGLIYSYNLSWDLHFMECAIQDIAYLRRLHRRDHREVQEMALLIFSYVAM
jgi:hypothetical protein